MTDPDPAATTEPKPKRKSWDARAYLRRAKTLLPTDGSEITAQEFIRGMDGKTDAVDQLLDAVYRICGVRILRRGPQRGMSHIALFPLDWQMPPETALAEPDPDGSGPGRHAPPAFSRRDPEPPIQPVDLGADRD